MSATLTTANGTAKDTTRRGFGPLTCPLCGQDCAISLNLEDLETCTCPECSEEFTLDTVRDVIARWQKVLAWVDLCPAAE
jgi:hypothetical protein